MTMNEIMMECNEVLELKGESIIRDEKTYRNDLGQLAKYNLIDEKKLSGKNAKTNSGIIQKYMMIMLILRKYQINCLSGNIIILYKFIMKIKLGL